MTGIYFLRNLRNNRDGSFSRPLNNLTGNDLRLAVRQMVSTSDKSS